MEPVYQLGMTNTQAIAALRALSSESDVIEIAAYYLPRNDHFGSAEVLEAAEDCEGSRGDRAEDGAALLRRLAHTTA